MKYLFVCLHVRVKKPAPYHGSPATAPLYHLSTSRSLGELLARDLLALRQASTLNLNL